MRMGFFTSCAYTPIPFHDCFNCMDGRGSQWHVPLVKLLTNCRIKQVLWREHIWFRGGLDNDIDISRGRQGKAQSYATRKMDWGFLMAFPGGDGVLGLFVCDDIRKTGSFGCRLQNSDCGLRDYL